MFSDDQRINISAGDSASFYVYTTNKLSYQFSNTWEEGSTVTDNGSLRLFAGIALAYGKWEDGCGAASLQQDGRCIFAPRVFSGVLEYTSSTVTAPIIPTIEFRTLDQKSVTDNHGRGLMFNVRAKADIVIEGFDILSRTHAVSNVLIYTRGGGFHDTALSNSHDGFALLYEGNIPDQEGKLFMLDDFKQNVRISRGDTQTFYVYSQKGLMYEIGNQLGLAYAEDDSIVIHEGRVTKRWFRKPRHGSGKWAGTIRYVTSPSQ